MEKFLKLSLRETQCVIVGVFRLLSGMEMSRTGQKAGGKLKGIDVQRVIMFLWNIKDPDC